MSQKILKFIVVFLALLIFLCFLALVYGLYIKIGKKQSNLETNKITYNLNLDPGHEITDIDLIDNNKLLFTIKNNNEIYALIYDTNNKNIVKVTQEND
tara:strand:- start:134 stop:427 length:294 start_codon:yes stop_codon:yes gene_type:complete